jgi:hypothetical protein
VDKFGNIFAQRVRGFFERIAHRRVVTPSVKHANGLGPLARKDKSKCGHKQVFKFASLIQ